MYSCETLIATEKEFASSEKRLSICLQSNGFSFSEVTLSGVLLTFGEVRGAHAATMTGMMADIKSLFATVGIRPFGYTSMELVVMTDQSVWVPDELYDPAAGRHYLNLVGAQADNILAAACPSLASTSVFTADAASVTAFKVSLPGLKVTNQHVKLAEMAQSRHCAASPVLLTHWRGHTIDFAAFSEGRYVYGNSVPFADDNEALFHTVEVVKSYGLENAGTALLMCGEVERGRFNLLRPYFPSASLYTGTHTSFLNPAFKTLHTYRNALIL